MLDAPALDDLAWSTAGHLAAEVTAGRLKTLEIVEVTLARIRARDPLLNSFTAVTEERAAANVRVPSTKRARAANRLDR
jgi:1-carboxybiuret hydrolase